jgi:8-amino-7-oxononanoate synthase
MHAQLEANPLWRFRHLVDGNNGKHIIIDGKQLINFAGNDYLALANHADIKSAFANAAQTSGLGSTSSPLFAGYTRAHQDLENEFVAFIGRERALVFNSGYHANLAIMTTFADRHTNIVADKFCHASLLDGFTLSRAKIARYRHQDSTHAAQLLARSNNDNKLLVTESVFSMEGNITRADLFANLAAKNNARFIIDDAHGIGVLGKNGKGIVEHANLKQKDVFCLVTPLGKAPGSMGAIVTGSNEMIEEIIQNARSYRYSTMIPAAICAATITSIGILANEHWRREKLHALITFFNTQAKLRGLQLSSLDETPIRCVLIGDSHEAMQLQNHLFNHGYFIACARPPAVPIGTARLRVSLTCMQDESDIEKLLDLITEFHAKRTR